MVIVFNVINLFIRFFEVSFVLVGGTTCICLFECFVGKYIFILLIYFCEGRYKNWARTHCSYFQQQYNEKVRKQCTCMFYAGFFFVTKFYALYAPCMYFVYSFIYYLPCIYFVYISLYQMLFSQYYVLIFVD